MRHTRLIAMVGVAAALLMVPVTAQAVPFTVDGSNSVVPGGSVDFNATLSLEAGDPDPLILLGISLTLNGVGLSTDDTPFFAGWPLQLDSSVPGTSDTFSGPLFTVLAGLGVAPPGPYLGSVTLILASAAPDSEFELTRPFEVTVQGAPPVPEPGLLTLLGVGLAGLAARRSRTR